MGDSVNSPDGEPRRCAHDERIKQSSRRVSRHRKEDLPFNFCSFRPLKSPHLPIPSHSPQRHRQNQSWDLEVFAPQFLGDLVPTLNLRGNLVVIRVGSVFGIPHFPEHILPRPPGLRTLTPLFIFTNLYCKFSHSTPSTHLWMAWETACQSASTSGPPHWWYR